MASEPYNNTTPIQLEIVNVVRTFTHILTQRLSDEPFLKKVL